MSVTIEDVCVSELIPHEMINIDRLSNIIHEILTTRKIYPIIVDRETKIVIDGSHRLVASKWLGHKTIPVRYVDMMDENIILQWRDPVSYDGWTKQDIVTMVVNGGIFPPKSTRFMSKKENGELIRLYEME